MRSGTPSALSVLLKLCALALVLMVVITALGRAIDYEETHHGPYPEAPHS